MPSDSPPGNHMLTDRPPVHEMGLSVQFAKDVPWTALDVTDFRSRIFEAYPDYREMPRASPMSVEPENRIVLGTNEGRRAWFISPDDLYVLQVQNDRVCRNWRSRVPTDAPSGYPGYNILADQFDVDFEYFVEWLRQKTTDANPITPNVGELAYYNTISTAGGRRLSEILSFFKPNRRSDIIGFNAHWAEMLPVSFRAFTTVHTEVDLSRDGVPAVFATMISRFDLSGCDIGGIRHRFDEVHGAYSQIVPHVLTDMALGR